MNDDERTLIDTMQAQIDLLEADRGALLRVVKPVLHALRVFQAGGNFENDTSYAEFKAALDELPPAVLTALEQTTATTREDAICNA